MNARRADAQRSVERIVAAAGLVFRRDGPDAPLDRIAREAGTGSATLHRHFAGRRALLVAVFEATVAELAADAQRAEASAAPGEALWLWLDSVVRHCAIDAGLAAALRQRPGDELSWSPLAEAGAPLLEAAAASGRASPEVTIDDLLVFVDAIATHCPHRPDDAASLLAVVRAGAGNRGALRGPAS